MKYFLILIISVFIACNNTNKTDIKAVNVGKSDTTKLFVPKNDLQKNNLKGRVKNITEHCYYAKEKNGKLKKLKLSYWVIYKYDSLGNQLLESEYDNEGFYDGDTTNTTYRYKYDTKRNIIEKYQGNDSLFQDSEIKFICKYDINRRKIEEDNYWNLTLDFKLFFKYDTKGNMTEEDDYENGNLLVDKMLYSYDSIGNMIEEIHFTFPSEVGYKKKGEDKNFFKYDSNRNLIELFSCNLKDTFLEYSKKYDNKNNQIKYTVYNENNTFQSSTEYKYDYDKTGNWIREIDFEHNKPTMITERVIEYY